MPCLLCPRPQVHRASRCLYHPLWDYVRDKVARKAIELREQGFSGAAMLPYSELEYGGIVERMKKLDKQFKIRT